MPIALVLDFAKHSNYNLSLKHACRLKMSNCISIWSFSHAFLKFIESMTAVYTQSHSSSAGPFISRWFPRVLVMEIAWHCEQFGIKCEWCFKIPQNITSRKAASYIWGVLKYHEHESIIPKALRRKIALRRDRYLIMRKRSNLSPLCNLSPGAFFSVDFFFVVVEGFWMS